MQEFIGTQIVESAQERSTTPFDHGYEVPSPYTGHLNWIPKKDFEENYRRTDAMTFGQALEVMRLQDVKVRRRAWTDTTYLFRETYKNGSVRSQIMQRVLWEPRFQVYSYQPSQPDMAAEDWMIITPELNRGMERQGTSLK